MSLFLSNKYKYRGKELSHKETRIGVANTNIIDSVTTRQLQLSPELPEVAQKWHGFNETDWTIILVPGYPVSFYKYARAQSKI